MKISRDNVTIYAGRQDYQREAFTDEKEGKKVFFAGDMTLTSAQIEEKRNRAKEQAADIIKSVYKNDEIIANDLRERRNRIAEIKKELSDINDEVKRIDGLKDELRESMGVEIDSEEHKELELLEKPYFELTKEERERVAEIRKDGLTDYQSQALEYNKAKAHFGKMASELKKEMFEQNAIVEATKRELVKNTSMIEGEKQAQIIKESASDEIIRAVVEESKKKLEEEIKEQEEKAEKIEEQKELRKEEVDKEDKEELIKESTQSDIMRKDIDVKQKVQEIIDETKLSVEEILGSLVDVNL